MTKKLVGGGLCRFHRPPSKQLRDGCEHGVTSAVMRTFRLASSWSWPEDGKSRQALDLTASADQLIADHTRSRIPPEGPVDV